MDKVSNSMKFALRNAYYNDLESSSNETQFDREPRKGKCVTKPPVISVFKYLVAKRVHLGHNRCEVNQKNAPYLFYHRKDAHIIDVRWSNLLLNLALKFLISATSSYNRILFFLSNKYETLFQTFQIILNSMQETSNNMSDFKHSLFPNIQFKACEWIPGALTNYLRVRHILSKLKQSVYMPTLPTILLAFNLDLRNSFCIPEAAKLGIPQIALIDSPSPWSTYLKLIVFLVVMSAVLTLDFFG
jgi:ribosomal protein S2